MTDAPPDQPPPDSSTPSTLLAMARTLIRACGTSSTSDLFEKFVRQAHVYLVDAHNLGLRTGRAEMVADSLGSVVDDYQALKQRTLDDQETIVALRRRAEQAEKEVEDLQKEEKPSNLTLQQAYDRLAADYNALTAEMTVLRRAATNEPPAPAPPHIEELLESWTTLGLNARLNHQGVCYQVGTALGAAVLQIRALVGYVAGLTAENGRLARELVALRERVNHHARQASSPENAGEFLLFRRRDVFVENDGDVVNRVYFERPGTAVSSLERTDAWATQAGHVLLDLDNLWTAHDSELGQTRRRAAALKKLTPDDREALGLGSAASGGAL